MKQTVPLSYKRRKPTMFPNRTFITFSPLEGHLEEFVALNTGMLFLCTEVSAGSFKTVEAAELKLSPA